MVDERVLLRRTSTFDPVALSARLARRFVRGLLEDAGRDVWVEAATLAVTEVVTNAVLHAHTTFDVTAVVTQHQLLVEVLDHNPAPPAQRSYAAEATTGRGMDLVSAYTSASGVRPLGASGKLCGSGSGTSRTARPKPSRLLTTPRRSRSMTRLRNRPLPRHPSTSGC